VDYFFWGGEGIGEEEFYGYCETGGIGVREVFCGGFGWSKKLLLFRLYIESKSVNHAW